MKPIFKLSNGLLVISALFTYNNVYASAFSKAIDSSPALVQDGQNRPTYICRAQVLSGTGEILTEFGSSFEEVHLKATKACQSVGKLCSINCLKINK